MSCSVNNTYYHPLRQSAPYFDDLENSDDGNFDSVARRSSISDSSMGGSRNGQHVRWNLKNATTNESSGFPGTPIRRGNSVQNRLSGIAENGSLTYQGNQGSIQNEADAAAGGGFFPRRVSSFNLLNRTASAETLGKSSSSITGSMTNATSTNINQAGTFRSLNDLNSTTSQLIIGENGRRLYHKHRLHTMVIPPSISPPVKPDWRLRDRMKTVGVGLIMSLNIGTDPPDIVKPNPCAVLQCWIDPRPTLGSSGGVTTTINNNGGVNNGVSSTGMTRAKARELIGDRLERQYSKWQLTRTVRPLKFRKALDPTVEDVRNLCIRLRREARNERILIHFNGHGVPKPTSHGEIWVFDKNHTEYIPLSVSDLRLWMGKPNIVVLDCSSAGTLMPFFTQSFGGSEQNMSSSQQPDQDNSNSNNVNKSESTNNEENENMEDFAWVQDTIVLCPCSENEWLPMHPNYPADIFTSCLTTPIPIALRWFIRQNQYMSNIIHPDSVDRIPGQANDRKTPLGELNWIFTAVTDSIAWNVLPKPLFQRLFRQDLLVASMFRNFLLADRILRSFGCTPLSYPPLPGTGTDFYVDGKNSSMADHPLWQAWDLACETMLFQLLKDGILTNSPSPANVGTVVEGTEPSWERNPVPPSANQQVVSAPQESISSPFFSEQLTAFEIWLDLAPVHKIQAIRNNCSSPESPEQLPVVLQVLLSPVNRLRALKLLQRFLDLGPWAVNLSLSLGIFPYVMKLLQSPEYKSLLVRIWASILAFDTSCRIDVLKDGALHHFLQHLLYGLNTENDGTLTQGDIGMDAVQAANERTLAAFVLASILHEYPTGQVECIRLNMHYNCCALLASFDCGDQSANNQQQEPLPFATSAQTRSIQIQTGEGSVADKSKTIPLVENLFPPHFRLWLCLCMGNLVKDNIPIQNEAYNAGFQDRLGACLNDHNPEVRAAACYALGALAGSHTRRDSRSTSVQDMASLQFPQQQQSNMSFSSPPGFAGFNLNPRLKPSTPNLFVPGSVALGMTPMSTQLQPSFTLAAPNNMATPLATTHLQQNFQPMMPSGMQLTQGNQLIFQRQPQQQQLPQPMLQNFLNNPQQQGQLMLQHQQPLMQGLPYMLQSPMHQHTQHSQFSANGQQYQQPVVPGGFLVSPGSSIPMVLPQRQAPLINLPLNQAMQYQGTPQFPPNSGIDQGRHMILRPNVYEESNRLELDLSCAELLLGSVLHDGSVVVRYEVAIALGAIIGKYLEAFVVAAEESSKPSESASQVRTSISSPRGLDQSTLDRFRALWRAVREMKTDPFPAVTRAAIAIVSYVHDTLLNVRIETAKQNAELIMKNKKQASLLLGIDEEPTSDSASLVPNVGIPSVSRGISSQSNLSRGAVSEGTLSSAAATQKAEKQSSQNNADNENGSASPYTLPKSELYQWKKSSFDSNFGKPDDQDADPLSPAGAARSYRDRRNFVVREDGAKLARCYASLAPKPPKPKKKGFELMFEQEDESALLAAEEEARTKKGELEMKEKRLFRNDGVAMTALINFHPYEDYLMACGATDSVTLWDTESGKRVTKFENGNPKGSRMTSSFWINEGTFSHFLVGSDDGIVKIWSNILLDNGECCRDPPSLVSAFSSVPMEAGHFGTSGLVLEWQAFSGTLLAGGNSRSIRCWDLEAEKITNKFATNCNECVTTMTTAWQYESMGRGPSSQENSGISRNTVVAGFSDGSVRIFDMRMNAAVSEMRGSTMSKRPRFKPTVYNEHKSWVVNAAFTGYADRFELLTGTLAGEIKFWDLRMSASTKTLEVQRSTMTTLAVHQKIPIIATGSHAQFIKILTLDGDTMQVIRYHEKIANHRIEPVSCVTFHPNKPLFAAGATDTYIGLYATKKQFHQYLK